LLLLLIPAALLVWYAAARPALGRKRN
jgi:hypothetical protein